MQCNAMQCNAIQYNAMQRNAVQCNAMQYNTIQYNTILLKIFEVQDRYADLNTIISDFKKYQPPLI